MTKTSGSGSTSLSETEIKNEKRHFCRVPFISNAHISFDEQNCECHLLDISLKGLLIERPREFEMKMDTLYSVSLTLSKEVVIAMQAKVIHSEANHIGLQWVDIDLDSLTALRRLLELNLNDPEEIHREIADLVSIKY